MEKIKLKDVKKELSPFDKIVVTGPPRSGTTILSLILATELKYKFVDETYYVRDDDTETAKLFSFLLHHNRKMVLQMTAFTRDVHRFYFPKPTAIILSIRDKDSIEESMKNSTKFLKENSVVSAKDHIFTGFDDAAKNIILKYFGANEGDSLPEVIYNHFYNNINPNYNYFGFEYEELQEHKLFIKKEERRKNFIHLKQVDLDPEYINKKGIMIL